MTRADAADEHATPCGPGGAWHDVPVHAGGSLAVDTTVTGPVIIEEPTTTIVVPEGAIADRATGSLPRGGHAMSAAAFDRVDLAVMANRFDGIVREMENTLLAHRAVVGDRPVPRLLVFHRERTRRARRLGRGPPGSRLRIGARVPRDAHAAPRPRRRRRVPAQRPVRRQHARRRPHDSRPHVLRR